MAEEHCKRQVEHLQTQYDFDYCVGLKGVIRGDNEGSSRSPWRRAVEAARQVCWPVV